MTFCVIGSDERQQFLARHLVKSGVKMVPLQQINSADVAVFPLPLAKEQKVFFELCRSAYPGKMFGGLIGKEEWAVARGLYLVDYAQSECFALQNAIPSAEGAIFEIMSHTKKTLWQSRVCIVGYGRIARILSRILLSFGAKVTVCARRSEARAEAQGVGLFTCEFFELADIISQSDVLVNTVPFPVIDDQALSSAGKEIFLLDLASSPGGISSFAAAAVGLSVDWALSLPARFAPDTAAEFVLNAINENIKIEGSGV